MIWFIADTHFNHANIVLYCGRSFKDAEDMDDNIIWNWNKIVNPEDTIYHLGDFALCRTEEYQKYIDALNGKMILIMGNHDRRRTVTFWKKRGIEAHKNPIIFLPDQYENELPWLLSHEPVMFPDLPNVHGHTHGNIHRGEVSEHGIHVCVSVEVTGYKPVSVDWVKQEIKRKEELNGR